MIDPTVSAYYTGDCRKLLKQLPAGCAQTCITSPPYWGLRDYDVDGQIGLESTPQAYVDALVAVFEGVRRVLRDDGTLWLNLGDCYASNGGHVDKACNDRRGAYRIARRPEHENRKFRARGSDPKNRRKGPGNNAAPNRQPQRGLKHKDLVGIPWMVAFALRDAGWYLRMDCIWSKPNPMPESVTDRPTKAHEYLFLLAKSEEYYYDHKAISERVVWEGQHRNIVTESQSAMPGAPAHKGLRKYKSGNGFKRPHRLSNGRGNEAVWEAPDDGKRNKRSVWTVPGAVTLEYAVEQAMLWRDLAQDMAAGDGKPSVLTVTPVPYHGAHFATYPPELIEPCVLAGSRVGDLVLDPFFGSGTTGEVAEKYERRWIGFDINPKYADLAKHRTAQRSLPLARSGR